MMKKRKKKILLLVILCLMVFLAANVFGMKQIYDDSRNTESVVGDINREYEWNRIEAILRENIDKAYIQSTEVAKHIEIDILEAYPDLDVLRELLHGDNNINNDLPDDIYDIFRNRLEGKYLNIDNDRNDMWVFTRQGIAMDLSLESTREYGVSRDWENELAYHYNKTLGADTIKNIMKLTDDLFVWETKEHKDPNHKYITSSSIENIKEVFIKEGLEGLRNYEFLAPAFITNTGDIFGNPDITNSGVLNTDNHKIIVVQGFNLYDQVTRQHTESTIFHNNTQEVLEKGFDNTDNKLLILMTLLGAINIIIIFTVCIIYNYECKE